MTMAATISPALRAVPGPALPVARLVTGKDVGEVATLIPRLFSLCRAAQAAAVNRALGLPVDDAGMAREFLRDHLVKLCVTWPRLLGLGHRTVPFATGDLTPAAIGAIRADVFGSALVPPATGTDFDAFLASGQGVAAVLGRIDACFAPGVAVANGLPTVEATNIWQDAPTENSTASRHLGHPVMAHIEKTHGRGPLWRATARLYDIDMALTGSLPPISTLQSGAAMVPATRGSYAVRIEHKDNIVTAFARMTPTDSLLAQGGILERSLASLPAEGAGLAPLMLDILDPCSPVRLEGAQNA